MRQDWLLSLLFLGSFFLNEHAVFVAACRRIAPLGSQNKEPPNRTPSLVASVSDTAAIHPTDAWSGQCPCFGYTNVWPAGRSPPDCFTTQLYPSSLRLRLDRGAAGQKACFS